MTTQEIQTREENAMLAEGNNKWYLVGGLVLAGAVGYWLWQRSKKDADADTDGGGDGGGDSDGDDTDDEPKTFVYQAEQLNGVEVELLPRDTLVIQTSGPAWSLATDYPDSAITPGTAVNNWKIEVEGVSDGPTKTWDLTLMRPGGGGTPPQQVPFTVKVVGTPVDAMS